MIVKSPDNKILFNNHGKHKIHVVMAQAMQMFYCIDQSLTLSFISEIIILLTSETMSVRRV